MLPESVKQVRIGRVSVKALFEAKKRVGVVHVSQRSLGAVNSSRKLGRMADSRC